MSTTAAPCSTPPITPTTELNSNIPVTLYYCAALSVLHAIFFLSEHVPEVRDLVTSHYDEMLLVIMAVAAAIHGCRCPPSPAPKAPTACTMQLQSKDVGTRYNV